MKFAYYRQSEVDKENAPYYLECFQGIARGRKSESLETEAAMITSLGTPNRREIEDAYRALGIEPAHGAGLTDNFLIDQARSRLPDISPSQREELRRHLKVIGFARNSEAIRREANESIDTYEDAVRWLDFDPSGPDDFVCTMFAIKVCLQQRLPIERSLTMPRHKTTPHALSKQGKRYLSSLSTETATDCGNSCMKVP